MSNIPQIPFRPAAVEPVECIKAGWELVKPKFWLFLGIALVGMLVASAVPLGILMGPMMCGIYLSFFKTRRGEPIEFGTLFKGFDYFGPSIIATLIHAVPIMAIVVPAYIGFYVAIFVSAAAGDQNAGLGAALMIIFVLVWLVIFVAIMVLSILFTFAYPLIVDRGLQGFDAVKLSFKAAFANFWRLLGLTLLNGCLSFVGMLLCIVGVYLVLPITLAANAMAFEQVFGLRNPADVAPNVPPPPPTF